MFVPPANPYFAGQNLPSGGHRFTPRPLPTANEESSAWQTGASIPGLLNRSKVLRPLGMYLNLLRTNPMASTLLTSAAGGLAGYGLGKIRNQNPGATGLAGLVAGGLAGGLLSNSMNRRWLASGVDDGQSYKQASSFSSSSSDLAFIEQQLTQDQSLDPGQQDRLLGLLNALSPNQVRILANLIKGVFGGSVGAIIARYVLGLGFAGSAFGAAAGALAGGGNPFSPHNALGQSTAAQSPFGGPSFQF